MKLKRLLKECPILIGITTIAIILTVIGLCFKSTVYAEYSSGEFFEKRPPLEAVLSGIRDEVYPWSTNDEAPSDEVLSEEAAGTAEEIAEDQSGSEEGGAEDASENAEAESGNFEEADDSSFDISGNSSDSSEDEAEEEDKVYEFTEVDDDYFCDALFIGDSRTVGLSEYCEELDSRATFYSKVSLTIYTCMDKEFISTDDGKISVDQALRENQFAKIYICLGLNEIGTGDPEYFKNAYAGVIDRIIELQPDAIIYIQGIMHVTANKSDHDKYFTNDNINARNAAIAELADQKRIFYIDINDYVDDGNGNLDSSLTFDDVHLKASSYERWHEFLLHNAIVR